MTRVAVMLALTLAVGIAAEVTGAQISYAQQLPDPRVADLVQTGELRAGVGVVAPHWAAKDPATGELRGVAVDIARALAKRLGVELVMVEYPSPPSVLDGLKTGGCRISSDRSVSGRFGRLLPALPANRRDLFGARHLADSERQ
jgi:ABC-type amino acid transport substrate-binding protein